MGESDELADFLENRDTVHLIVDIGVEPRRLSDLVERVSISESAFANRMTTGRNLGVWWMDVVETEAGDQRVYRLTDEGEVAFGQLDEMGAVEASLQAREHLPVVWEAKETLVNRLRDED